jgi:high-affinity iron transporter
MCVLGLVMGLGLASVRDGACADSADAVAPVSGDAVYRAQCAMCHGAGGRGDGPAAAMLLPKPRDLSSPDFWAGRTLESVADVVREGKPGTAMMGYQSVLTPEEIREVVAYLRTLGTR